MFGLKPGPYRKKDTIFVSSSIDIPQITKAEVT
jgi:hypothetical protein